MAAAIRAETGVETELIPGDKGIFDVVVDRKKIFSKYDVGRFPENSEILALLGSG